MKLFKYIALLVFINLTSCSNESIDNNSESIILTNYIYKNYNVTNTPNTVIDSTNYQIFDNKIISSSGLNIENLDERTSTYSYSDSKIEEIQSFIEGSLNRSQSYSYDTNGNLIEYLTVSFNIDSQPSNYERHTFNHTSDTIFSSWKRSDDGINYNINVSDSKIVLNENDNRTYFEAYNYFNNETSIEVNNYDTNFNITNDSKYLRMENGNNTLSFENNYTYNTTLNLYNLINEATFTRKNLMLLFHLQSNAINNINAKSISRNNLATFESTWGNSIANFEITNTTDENNSSLFSDYKTIIAGNTFARFTQEYIFEE